MIPIAVAKIAITVDPDLLARVEELRRTTKESRSAVVNRALRILLRERDHAARVERYVSAHTEMPETSADTALAEALAVEALATIDWDEDGFTSWFHRAGRVSRPRRARAG